MKPKRAPSSATAMSATATSPTPPPSAAPCTHATTAFGERSIVSNRSTSSRGVGQVLLAREAGHRLHPLEVGAGAEGGAAAGEHDDADVLASGGGAHRLAQLAHHRPVEGVAHLGPREHDVRDRAVETERDARFAHAASMPRPRAAEAASVRRGLGRTPGPRSTRPAALRSCARRRARPGRSRRRATRPRRTGAASRTWRGRGPSRDRTRPGRPSCPDAAGRGRRAPAAPRAATSSCGPPPRG